MMSSVKEHGVNISLSTVATLIPVLTVIWFIIQPALLASVITAVQADITMQVKAQTAPLQSAFKSIILADMNKLKRAIAALEFRQRRNGPDWTSNDAVDLTELRIELNALQEAYKQL